MGRALTPDRVLHFARRIVARQVLPILEPAPCRDLLEPETLAQLQEACRTDSELQGIIEKLRQVGPGVTPEAEALALAFTSRLDAIYELYIPKQPK